MKKLTVAVVGSRTIDDPYIINDLIDTFIVDFTTTDTVPHIISGGADGVDSAAIDYAKDNGIPYKEYLAPWKEYGRMAGMIRNTMLIDLCDISLVIWDGESKGTLDSINKLAKAKKPFRTINAKHGTMEDFNVL